MAQQNYKKFVASAATATLVASALVPMASANVNTSAFTDVGSNYKDAVEFLVSNNISKGYSETQYGINMQIKRGDAAIMIANAAGLNNEEAASAGFSDVPKRGALAVNSLKAAGVIDGKSTTRFGFEDNLTRGEAAIMLKKAFKLEAGDVKNEFTDVKDFYDAAVDALVANKVTKGINDTQFGTANNIKRGDFAMFLYALKDKIKVDSAVVSSVEVTNPTTLSVKLKEAKQGLTAADFSVVVDGDVVVPTAVVADSSSENYTLTIPTLDGKAGTVAVNKVEASYNFAKAEVASVKAINASELKVTFSAPVTEATATEKANYELKVNNNLISASNIQDIQLSEDGKTATILLDQSGVKSAFQNGDKYVIQTNDAIVAKNGSKLEKFVSNETTFSETAAPALTKVVKSGDNLVLTFDRPVDATATNDVTLVKVDGIEIGSKELKPVSPKAVGSDVLGKAGDYRYTIAISDTAAKAEAKKVGAHEVVIFDVKDTASDYAANASVLTGSYTVTDAVTTPEVTGIEAVNANRFFVSTNVPVTLGSDAVVTVNKGTHEFALENTKFEGTIQSADTVTVSDAVVGTYNGKDGIWVTVTDNKGNTTEENPLYRTGEATVNLSVTVEKFTADGLIGKKSTQNVTLNKNNTKPVVDTTVLKEVAGGNDQLVVTFTNPLVKLDGTTGLTLAENTDFVVRDKEGIIIEGFSAVVSGKDVTLTHNTSADLKDAPYTVEFKEGKFKNAENRTSVANYLANTIKNDKFTVSVGKEVASNFKYTEYKINGTNSTVVQSADENSITLTYPTKMGDSARNVANYTLDGKALPTGTTIDFVNDRKTVKVVFPKGTFKTSTQYKFGVTSNVKTEAGSMIVGSLQTKAPAELVFGVTDNVKPELASAVYYVGTETVTPQTKTNQIEVTFNEAVNIAANATNKAANDFGIKINGSMYTVASVAQATTGDNKENKLVLTLVDDINVSQAATITIVPEADQTGTALEKEIAVKDTAGNKAKEGSQVTLAAGNVKYNAALAQQQTALDQTAVNTATFGTPQTLRLADGINSEAKALAAVKAQLENGADLKGSTLTVESTSYTAAKTDGTAGSITVKYTVSKGAATPKSVTTSPIAITGTIASVPSIDPGTNTANLMFNIAGNVSGNAEVDVNAANAKAYIAATYNGAVINFENIEVIGGTLQVKPGTTLITPADWAKIKANGNPAIPYRVTVKDNNSAKAAKIVMNSDGSVVFEKLQ